jgi:hypothetical protein
VELRSASLRHVALSTVRAVVGPQLRPPSSVFSAVKKLVVDVPQGPAKSGAV